MRMGVGLSIRSRGSDNEKTKMISSSAFEWDVRCGAVRCGAGFEAESRVYRCKSEEV